MAFEFHFQIDASKICVQDVRTGYQLVIKNHIVYCGREVKLLALGKTEDEVRNQLRGLIERNKIDIQSVVMFDTDIANWQPEILAIEHVTRLLHRQLQRAKPLSHFFTKLVDGFDYVFTIQNYSRFSETRRSTFEQYLQAHLRLRRLVINGQEVQISFWRRSLEYWIRYVLFWVLPLGLMVLGYLNIPTSLLLNPVLLLCYLLIITYFFHGIGKIMWMLLARQLVPQEYRIRMLQGKSLRLSYWNHLLARVFWGVKKSSEINI